MTNIKNNQGAIQSAIKKLGGVAYPTCCTWSSSEYTNVSVWYSHLEGSVGLSGIIKNHYERHTVRPVMEF